MLYPVLTYSRDLGDFTHNLSLLHQHGLKAIRLIYKGKSEAEFSLRINEIQKEIKTQLLDIDLLIDLPGNKPTVGIFSNKGIDIISGHTYTLIDQESADTLSHIPTINFFSHNNFRHLAPNETISIADDELNLRVLKMNETGVLCEAMNTYHLTSNRSISVKNNPFDVEANSKKDIQFVQNLNNPPANLKLLVSFTKRPEEILRLKALQPQIEIIPKIEHILDDMTMIEILACCETVLLGRGDLSTSYQAKEIFKFQQRLIKLCKEYNKKIIIGTGLLTGIGEKLAPSIPEVMDYSYLRSMDVSAFLITGSNALKQPIKTLQFMNEFEQ